MPETKCSYLLPRSRLDNLFITLFYLSHKQPFPVPVITLITKAIVLKKNLQNKLYGSGLTCLLNSVIKQCDLTLAAPFLSVYNTSEELPPFLDH